MQNIKMLYIVNLIIYNKDHITYFKLFETLSLWSNRQVHLLQLGINL